MVVGEGGRGSGKATHGCGVGEGEDASESDATDGERVTRGSLAQSASLSGSDEAAEYGEGATVDDVLD